MKWALLLFLVLPMACNDIPQDPEGTLERVRTERRFKVGIVADGAAQVGRKRQAYFLSRVSDATGARPEVEAGASEPLLTKLEEGELDLVTGAFAPTSPWAKHVTLLPPLGEQITSDGHVVLAAAARNGENAWIALLHREARAAAALP